MRLLLSWTAIIVFGLVSSACASKEYRLATSPVAPAATGNVMVSTDDNGNTVVNLQVRHLAPASRLAPPREGYVVWTRTAGEPPTNQGQLRVNDNLEAQFRTITQERTFDLVVSAEDNLRSSQITGPIVLQANIDHSE